MNKVSKQNYNNMISNIESLGEGEGRGKGDLCTHTHLPITQKEKCKYL